MSFENLRYRKQFKTLNQGRIGNSWNGSASLYSSEREYKKWEHRSNGWYG